MDGFHHFRRHAKMAAQAAARRGREQDAGTQPAPAPDPKPQPKITVEPVPVTYYRPTVVMPGGETIVCGHKYLHETEQTAAACGRKIAAAGAFVK
jgi:hypothetical protein